MSHRDALASPGDRTPQHWRPNKIFVANWICQNTKYLFLSASSSKTQYMMACSDHFRDNFACVCTFLYPSNSQILLEILQNLVWMDTQSCFLIGIDTIWHNENWMFLHKQAHSYCFCRNIQFSLYPIVLMLITISKITLSNQPNFSKFEAKFDCWMSTKVYASKQNCP